MTFPALPLGILTFSLFFLSACSTPTKPQKITPAVLTALPKQHIQAPLPRFIQSKKKIDSWQHLISLFSIPEQNNPKIEKELQTLLRNPHYIEMIQSRAEPYLYTIIEAVKKKNLPGELALLPAVESAFKAHAYSHARAAGLWQFIPSTGRMFGLKQNWWYDGRRDVYSSTQAATDYLHSLGQHFDNDWLLALASYNAGRGNVNRAIKRNIKKHRATQFWDLRLPKETQRYVPKLLALAKLFANAEKYGIQLKKLEHKPHYSVVNIGSQLNLSKAAELSNMTLDELSHLNPGFNHDYTPPEGPHRLLIPVAKAEQFEKKLALLPDSQRMQLQRHKIKQGESLGSIAHQYQLTTKVLRNINHLKKNTIRAGKYLFIPMPKVALKNTRSLKITANPIHYPRYTVKAGDSLWRIARNLDLHSKDIARWNKIGLHTPLYLGQKLIIKQTKGFKISRADSNQPAHYTVRSGDSLSVISEKFDVAIDDLRKWNKHTLNKYLQPGQRLKVKAQPST